MKPSFSLRCSIVVALGLVSSLALAAGARVEPLSAPVRVVFGKAANLDATHTEVWLVDDKSARPLVTLNHARGLIPRGVRDEARGATWLIVADGGARDGYPATLWRVGDDGSAQEVLGGVWPRQRPAVGPDGSVVVFAGPPEQEGQVTPWTIHRVVAPGPPVSVPTPSSNWVVPVTSSDGQACFLGQRGWEATLWCGDGSRVDPLFRFRRGLVRDVSLEDGRLVALETVQRESVVIRVDLATGRREELGRRDQPLAEPIARAGTVLWSEGAGQGLTAVVGEKRLERQVAGEGISVPLVLDGAGRFAVVRIDSVDASRQADARMPSRFVVVDLFDNTSTTLRTGGDVVEIYGIAGGPR